ncbi:unnamed protein product [Adineta steineri]|uniref:Uncharacterized protein n=1 Tax=Adineta steineri TaxID=433720 RepID=A0A813UDQ6_9BILA|nr:unnamed protein product [Adineta steineri]
MIVAGSLAVISTFFPSEYIGRLTGIMWTSAGVITCIQYGLVHLTTDVSQSWRVKFFEYIYKFNILYIYFHVAMGHRFDIDYIHGMPFNSNVVYYP